jgi:protein CpxP
MISIRSFTIAAALGALLAGGAVYAQGPGPGGPGRGPGGFGRGGGGLALRALNLTDAQREQVRTLTQQHREQNRAVADKMRAAMEAQQNAVQTIPVDEALIRSTTQELAEAQTEMALQRARLHSEILALLTPEQQAEAKKLQAERAARRDQMRQRMDQRRQQRQQP